MPKGFFQWFLFIVVGAVAAVVLAGLGIAAWFGLLSSPSVVIQNRSLANISNVVVSGSGFSESVGTIAAGDEIKVSMHPHGDSSIRIVFDANGQHYDSGDQAYIATNGERFIAKVNQTFGVSIERVGP